MTKHHEGRPPHPLYGPPLSGAPKVWGGVTFRPYRMHIGVYVRVSDDFMVGVYQPPHRGSYCAIVGGKALPTRFRSERTAALAGIKKAAT